MNDKAEMIGEASEFKLKSGKREIICLLQQDKALKCKEIVVSVYYGDNYTEKVSEEKYTIGGLDWDWVKVPVNVTKVGKYVVDIYNENDTFINSGYFEIKK